jgi:hypothetical protein
MESRGDANRPIGGRYHLISRLARGPVSERWSATDTVLARQVAVEFLDNGAATDPVTVDAFKRAATTAARLAHPGIMAIYDTGIHGGIPYLVTELPRGRTLRQVIDSSGPLPPNRAVTVGYQIASVLAVAHQAGITHGGLSLDEVAIGDDDRVKVGGFGPGAALPHRDRGNGSAPSSPAGDVSDAAALIYEILCGQSPGPLPTQLRTIRPGVGSALDRAVMAALPGGPVSTAIELRDALDDIEVADDATAMVVRDPTPAAAARPLARPQRRNQIGPLLVVLLVIAAVAAVAIVAVKLKGSGHNNGSAASSTTGTGKTKSPPVAITTVAAFDPPPGDGQEQSGKLPLLHDGKPATFWSTEEYTTAQFGGSKKGVGVSLLLDRQHSLKSLEVATPSGDWSAEVYVADRPASALSGWGQPVAHFTVTQRAMNIDLHSTKGAAVLLWITDLGDANPGTTTAGLHFRADIGELTFFD